MPHAMGGIQVHHRTLHAPRESFGCLLRLPEAALHIVLLKLDPCSLASAAVSCSQLSHAALATISKVKAFCSTAENFASFELWLEHNSTDLTNLTQCSISSNDPLMPRLHQLPCPQLRQLQLQRLQLQLGPAEGSPGVLQGCKDLTALHLQRCSVENRCDAFAAIAALPQLQSLSVERCYDRSTHDKFLFAELQQPLLLTQLSLKFDAYCGPDLGEQLSQLSSLVNLRSLKLAELSLAGMPGGLPSQLVNLTCLHIEFEYECPADQFQHLSHLTALQELLINCSFYDPSELSGMPHLSQLTSLQLARVDLGVSSSTTHSWTSLTALQSLTLEDCVFEPKALEAVPQLRVLCLESLEVLGGLKDLLPAICKLTLLTKLQLTRQSIEEEEPPPPAAAFTALTASTHLCSLELGLWGEDVPQDCLLFKPGTLYPHLHSISLLCEHDSEYSMPLSEQQLQQLCSCCPAVDSLVFTFREPLQTAALPLCQLSALTRLGANQEGAAAAAAAAAVTTAILDVAAQLTGLRQLDLWGLPCMRSPALLQLSSLTALQKVTLRDNSWLGTVFKSQARCGDPPDVWMQLLRHLLPDEACQQALREQCIAGPPAAPDIRQLKQLVVTMAAELAAAMASVKANGGADGVPRL